MADKSNSSGDFRQSLVVPEKKRNGRRIDHTQLLKHPHMFIPKEGEKFWDKGKGETTREIYTGQIRD